MRCRYRINLFLEAPFYLFSSNYFPLPVNVNTPSVWKGRPYIRFLNGIIHTHTHIAHMVHIFGSGAWCFRFCVICMRKSSPQRQVIMLAWVELFLPGTRPQVTPWGPGPKALCCVGPMRVLLFVSVCVAKHPYSQRLSVYGWTYRSDSHRILCDYGGWTSDPLQGTQWKLCIFFKLNASIWWNLTNFTRLIKSILLK